MKKLPAFSLTIMLHNLSMAKSLLNVRVFFKISARVLLNTSGHLDKSICQVYNMKPSDLFWKLEALNYNQSATRSDISHITMDALSVVKRQLQQGLAKEIKSNKNTQSKSSTARVDRLKLPAHMVRGSAQGSGPTAVQIKKERMGEGISTLSNISTATTVVFHGPKLDQESKKKRACE
jgi:DNA polymerase alpha subunit B